MTVRSLSELRPGEKGKVIRVGGGVQRRLFDMGLVTGSEVEVERVAPLGDPIEVRTKGCHLALRKEEAASVQVEAVQPLPLIMARPGESVQVLGFRAGRGLQRKLADMGLTPGVQIRVISSQMPGPVIVELRGAKLALGYGVAHKIMVAGV